MIPKGMKPEKAAEVHKAIAARVKAKFAKLNRPYAGDEVTHEIEREWAKLCKVKHVQPAPEKPRELGPVAEVVETKEKPLDSPDMEEVDDD